MCPFLPLHILVCGGKEKCRREGLSVNLFLSFEASEEICLCNSAGPCGTTPTAGPTLCGQVMGSSAANYPFLLLLVLTVGITSTSLSKGKIHLMYFLVIQFVCHVSKFRWGKNEISNIFSVLVVKMCSLGPTPKAAEDTREADSKP